MTDISPHSDTELPEPFLRWLERLRHALAPIPDFFEGTGSPEGVQKARRGARYYATDGAAGNRLFIKTTDGGNTGWSPYDAGGTAHGLGIWNYRTETAATPAAGRLQFDNVAIGSAANFYVNVTNQGALNMANFLATLATGDLLYLQALLDPSIYVAVHIGVPAVAAGVYTFPVTDIQPVGAAPTQDTPFTLITG